MNEFEKAAENKKLQKHPELSGEDILEETDTEDEPMLTEKEYQESIRWKIGEKKDELVKKKKTKWEIVKRVLVGFFVLAFYISSYQISTFTMALTPVILAFIIQSELINLDRNEKKDR